MSGSLFDGSGNRKYLVARERRAFVCAALKEGGAVGTFCLTLAFTGARISEVLALTPERIDAGNGTIVLETLKRRKRGVFRAIPVPSKLVAQLNGIHAIRSRGRDPKAKLWTWGRTTAWQHVKSTLRAAGVREPLTTPRAVRHAFGVDAVQNGVALNILQRWMGHARIETTAIYANVIGKEERALARRTCEASKRPLALSFSSLHAPAASPNKILQIVREVGYVAFGANEQHAPCGLRRLSCGHAAGAVRKRAAGFRPISRLPAGLPSSPAGQFERPRGA